MEALSSLSLDQTRASCTHDELLVSSNQVSDSMLRVEQKLPVCVSTYWYSARRDALYTLPDWILVLTEVTYLTHYLAVMLESVLSASIYTLPYLRCEQVGCHNVTVR